MLVISTSLSGYRWILWGVILTSTSLLLLLSQLDEVSAWVVVGTRSTTMTPWCPFPMNRLDSSRTLLRVLHPPSESSCPSSASEPFGDLPSSISSDGSKTVGQDSSTTTTTTTNNNSDNNEDLRLSESLDLQSTTISSSQEEGEVHILLNRNAKGVKPSIIQIVEDVAADYTNVKVHTTSTIEEAKQVIEEMTRNPPSLIIPLGGDGTLTNLLQLLWDAGMDVTTRNGRSSSEGEQVLSKKRKRRRQFPPIAYVAQGTGNALGSVVGCRPAKRSSSSSGGLYSRWKRRPSWLLGGNSRKHFLLSETLRQLLDAATGQRQRQQQQLNDDDNPLAFQDMDVVELPLMQVTTNTSYYDKQQDLYRPQEEKSELCFFSGVGFDSLMLQDYKDLQEWTSDPHKPLRRILFKDAFSSVLGYCVTLVTRTLPGCLQNQKHLINVRISTSDPSNTVWIDHRRGDIVRPAIPTTSHDDDHDIDEDDDDDIVEISPTTTMKTQKNVLLYQGEAGIVAVGSAPFYGGGLRLFPFARMTKDGMQLRIGRIHPLRGTMNIPFIFQGSYRDGRDDTFGCIDFMGFQFEIEILKTSTGYPIQHSGDFVGTSTKVKFQMMKEELDPIRFVTLLPPRFIMDKEE